LGHPRQRKRTPNSTNGKDAKGLTKISLLAPEIGATPPRSATTVVEMISTQSPEPPIKQKAKNMQPCYLP
jgi:hypothetical protein